jgi:hypothetical protein
MKTLFSLFFVCLWAINASAQTSVMDFYNAKVKAMSTADINGGSFTLNITKKDVANGYLAYDYSPALGYMAGVTKSPEEMAYFTSKNGKKFVAVASVICVDGIPCYARMPKFFTLENGGLVDKTDIYLPANIEEQIEQAVLEKTGKMQMALGTAVKLPMWVRLPKTGTTIQIGVQEFGDEKYKFHLACELTYNETNGTFTFVKK